MIPITNITDRERELAAQLEKKSSTIQKLWADRDALSAENARLKEALAEQPAQHDAEGPINEGWQIIVANGHSGYGVYAHMEDYPEEGAVLVMPIEQQAQQQEPAIWEGDRAYHEGRSEYEISVHGFRFGKHRAFWELTSIQQAEWVAKAAKRLYTSQPQRKPLTDEQSRRIYNDATYAASLAVFMTRMDAEQPDADDKGVSGWLQEAEDRVKRRAIEAAHGIKEQT